MIPSPGSDLHDLFDAATADLPPAPDQAPGARRIARRRRLTERSVGAALGAALVIGAGTFALDSPWRSGSGGGIGFGAAAGLADYKTRVAAILQEIWPIRGEAVKPAAGASQAFEIVAADGKTYPLTLRTDATATRPAVGIVLVSHGTARGSTGSEAVASLVYYRANVLVSLILFDSPAQFVSDAQLREMAATPEFSSLVELAKADHEVTPDGGAQASAAPAPTLSASPWPWPSSSPSPTPSASPSEPWGFGPSASATPSPSS